MSLLVMSPPECMQRLRATPVGRVATTHRAMPAIVPVNYVVRDGCVVFRTEPDGMLARACDGSVVGFEIDAIADDGRSGWSVMVVGTAELVGAEDTAGRRFDDLSSAAGDDRTQIVAIAIGTVSGRMLEAADAALEATG